MKTRRLYKTSSIRIRTLFLAVASCLATHGAIANPTAPVVTNGSATFASSGSTLTVTNTPSAIIHWQNFSINSGETTKFIQQSAASAVLNRVTGGDPSAILGTLQSNGRVFLINPAGITFGAGAVIDTAGLVASTLNMSDADFIHGRMRFDANVAAPGSVKNAGEIRTPNGGFVYLIAPQVENSGVISTPSGEAILAAGNAVEIVDSVDPGLRVLVSAQSADVNLSQLMVQNNGNIFSVLNSGRVSANAAVQDAAGKIYFKSAGNIETTASSVVEAKGTSTLDGGRFQGFADNAGVYKGTFNVSGRNGGFIETSGHWIDINDAQIVARALDPMGNGGTWLLDPNNVVIQTSGSDTNMSAGPNFTTTDDAAIITTGTIEAALNAGTSVSITTTTSRADSEHGDITVTDDITKTGGGNASLTLNAHRNIRLDPSVEIKSTSGKLNVTLNADSDNSKGGKVKISHKSKIISNGGKINLHGSSSSGSENSGIDIQDPSALNTGTGTGEITITGNLVVGDSPALLIGNLIFTSDSLLDETRGAVSLFAQGLTTSVEVSEMLIEKHDANDLFGKKDGGKGTGNDDAMDNKPRECKA